MWHTALFAACKTDKTIEIDFFGPKSKFLLDMLMIIELWDTLADAWLSVSVPSELRSKC